MHDKKKSLATLSFNCFSDWSLFPLVLNHSNSNSNFNFPLDHKNVINQPLSAKSISSRIDLMTVEHSHLIFLSLSLFLECFPKNNCNAKAKFAEKEKSRVLDRIFNGFPIFYGIRRAHTPHHSCTFEHKTSIELIDFFVSALHCWYHSSHLSLSFFRSLCARLSLNVFELKIALIDSLFAFIFN